MEHTYMHILYEIWALYFGEESHSGPLSYDIIYTQISRKKKLITKTTA